MTPDTLARIATAASALLMLTACQAPATPAPRQARPAVRPVATTVPAAPPGVDAAVISNQFSSVIWPATVDYHYHPAQNGPESLRFTDIRDDSLDLDGFMALREAVSDLGEIAAGPGTSGGVEGLRLGSVSVTAATDTDAIVAACYTFTALSYTIESGWDAIRTPAAAQATPSPASGRSPAADPRSRLEVLPVHPATRSGIAPVTVE